MTQTDRRTFLKATGALAAAALLPASVFAADTELKNDVAVAIVGMGRQGRSIAGELQKIKGVKIVAICDTDPRRLRSGNRRVAGATPYDDHKKLLDEAKDVSAVFVSTPTHLHRAIVRDALAAGKHVYCEAPIASTVEDCRAITEAARGASTICVAGLLGRSNPIYKLARTFYRSDAVRDLIAMRAQAYEKTSWRTPASDPARNKALNWRLDPDVSIGLAGEWGTHQFDVFNFFTDHDLVGVTGSGAIRLYKDGRKVDDTINATLYFDDGAVLQYAATLCNSHGGTHEIFFGSNAAIELAWTHGWMFKEADAPTQGWEVYANRQRFHNEEGITLIADATQLASQGKLEAGVGLPNPPLYYGLSDFLLSITEEAPIATPIDQGARATIVGILTDQAVRTGKTVTIDPALLGA